MYRILIVDDEKKLRDGIATLYDWNHLGFQVEACLENGKLAIDYLLHHPVDVVLCDIRMPVLDGIGFAKYIHDHKLPVKIVFLSGYSDFELAQKAIRYQVTDYILKPTTYMEIFTVFNKIKERLDGENRLADNPPAHIDSTSPVIPYIKQYVSENLATASLNKIALELNLTPNYLSKLFREQMDITFTEYLIMEKMDYACRLLRNVNFKIYEVALMCGYDNPKNFVKTFRQYKGCTPQEYRKGTMKC
ncbi:response regulator [Enterocloster aldenensis]|uniref:response regulator transcription factor n=1 Tax=Enterocloster aldenensis TaxID=358742 RepID=UPI004027B8C5